MSERMYKANGERTYLWSHEYIQGQAGKQLKVTFRFPSWHEYAASGAGEKDYPCSCDSFEGEVKGTPGYIECEHWLFAGESGNWCRTHEWIYDLIDPQFNFPIMPSVMK